MPDPPQCDFMRQRSWLTKYLHYTHCQLLTRNHRLECFGVSTMYCPKCGDVLVEEGATYSCRRGEMQMSQHMANCLRDSFVLRCVPPEQAVATSFRWGGQWYCPGCGVLMSEITGTNGVECPRCRGNLGPFIYGLIEHNPHKFGDEWG